MGVPPVRGACDGGGVYAVYKERGINMSEGFTPGPWTCTPSTDAFGRYHIPEIEERLEAIDWDDDLSDAENERRGDARDREDEANARLIAAAPELVATVANAAGSFLAVMEYLSGVCIHKAGTGRDCYPCDAYDSARKGLEAAQAMLARIRGEG